MTLIARETFFAGDRKITSGDVVDDKDPVVSGREHLFSKGARSEELSPVVHFPPRPHPEPDPEVVTTKRRRSRRRSGDPVDEGPAADTEAAQSDSDDVEAAAPADDEPADVDVDPARPRAVPEDPDDDAPVVE